MANGKKTIHEDFFARMKNSGATVVPEPEMKEVLRRYKVPVPRGRVCTTVDEAVHFCRESGFPVVLKIVSDRILHKTEYDGVRLDIRSEDEMARIFREMHTNAQEKPVPGYKGILVEEQTNRGIEVIIGLQHDPVFGPLIMAGLGGIYTDLLEDVVFRMLPVTRSEIGEMLRDLKGWPLLEGFRGSDKVDIPALVETIKSLADMGVEYAGVYESVDFNPVVVCREGLMVVDAKMTLADSFRAEPFAFERPRTELMENFFNPGSVAVLGASSVPGKIGNVILDSLANHEYRGRIYPINPNHREIMGIKCYPDVQSLPEIPELLVVVVDLERMPVIMDEIKPFGISNVLIVSGGGKELGGEREHIEKLITKKAREYIIRVIGPNCIGSFDGKVRFDSFFHSHERLLRPPAGPLGFITQSGTWGCVFLEKAEITGVSKMVSYGNRVDVDEGDLIAYLSTDPSTRVIGSYIEGLSEGRKFIEAARLAAGRKKPVVVFKTGRNRQASMAAVSHTGAYGGSYHVYRGIMEQAGIVLADSFHELYASCETLALQPPAMGNAAAMLSNGAGPMVNALDLFPSKGLSLVTLDRGSVKKMADHFSFFYIVENPVDVTGSASAEDYEFVINTLLDDANVNIIMPFFVFQDTPLDESIIQRLEGINRLKKKPIVCCAAGGPYTERMSRELVRVGIPVYPDVAQWVAAASALVQWGKIEANGR